MSLFVKQTAILMLFEILEEFEIYAPAVNVRFFSTEKVNRKENKVESDLFHFSALG